MSSVDLCVASVDPYMGGIVGAITRDSLVEPYLADVGGTTFRCRHILLTSVGSNVSGEVEIFLSIVNEEISRCRRWSHNRSIVASSYLGVVGSSYLGIICCCLSGASAVGEAISQCCKLSNMPFSSVEPYLGVVAGAISHYCRCPRWSRVVFGGIYSCHFGVVAEAISRCDRKFIYWLHRQIKSRWRLLSHISVS